MKKIWTQLWVILQTASVYGQIVFHEDFSKPNLFGEGPLAYYQRGNYHILAEKGRMVYDNDHWLADFSAEVKTEFLDGDDNQGYGLMFRTQDYENSYVFCISGNGYLELGGYKKGNWFTISKWERSDIIRKNGVNFVKVECRGTTINLFINGQFIKTIKDASYTAGYIGIVAYNKAHIHFDDLKVYESARKSVAIIVLNRKQWIPSEIIRLMPKQFSLIISAINRKAGPKLIWCTMKKGIIPFTMGKKVILPGKVSMNPIMFMKPI